MWEGKKRAEHSGWRNLSDINIGDNAPLDRGGISQRDSCWDVRKGRKTNE